MAQDRAEQEGRKAALEQIRSLKAHVLRQRLMDKMRPAEPSPQASEGGEDIASKLEAIRAAAQKE